MKRVNSEMSKTVPLDSSNGFGYVSSGYEVDTSSFPTKPFPELEFIQAITDETLRLSMIPGVLWLHTLALKVNYALILFYQN